MKKYFYLIIYARNELEALIKGKRLFEDLVKKYTGFTDMWVRTWGEDPSDENLSVLNVTHPKAKDLIEDIIETMWENFKEYITRARESMEKCTDEEIFEDYGTRIFCFYEIGEYGGWGVYLYNHELDGIINRTALKRALTKYSDLYQQRNKENPYKDLDVFIVPALIHN